MANYMKFAQYSNRQMGILVTDMPNLPSPMERGEDVVVPGRSGSIWRSEHAYDNLTLAVGIWVPPERVAYLSQIKAWLMGEGQLELAQNAAAYYRARVSEGVEYRPLNFQSGYTATVVFSCDPFQHVRAADTLEIAEPQSVLNLYNVFAEPLWEITGNGDIDLQIGAQSVGLEGVSGSVYLDSELQECYTQAGLANHLMTGAFPVLPPGLTSIDWTGSVTEIRIIPRWRFV